MTQKFKRKFFSWNYEAECEAVNERSAQGYHMVKSDTFSRTEEYDPAVTYRYLVDCQEDQGFTEMLYEKQGWELVCTQGKLLWFRKKYTEDRMESEYEIHGEPRTAMADWFHRRLKRMDMLRNILLVVTFILVLIPAELTHDITPRIAALPLLLCILPVKMSGYIRGQLGEEIVQTYNKYK